MPWFLYLYIVTTQSIFLCNTDAKETGHSNSVEAGEDGAEEGVEDLLLLLLRLHHHPPHLVVAALVNTSYYLDTYFHNYIIVIKHEYLEVYRVSLQGGSEIISI